jgi:hypothetical protein
MRQELRAAEAESAATPETPPADKGAKESTDA